MKIHFETERLIVRDIEPKDVQGIFELDSNPAVHEYLGNNPITTMEQAEKVVAYIRAQYDKNGIGRWAVINKEDNDFIGWTGLKYEQELRNDFSYYDLGYRLKQNYWRQGIATETAMLSLQYGFKKLHLKEICAAADVNNIGSNKVLKKVGLCFKETFRFKNALLNWYTISKSEWVDITKKE